MIMLVEPPATLVQRGLDVGRAGRIDHRSFAAVRLMQQDAVVVGQARNKNGVENSHARSLIKL